MRRFWASCRDGRNTGNARSQDSASPWLPGRGIQCAISDSQVCFHISLAVRGGNDPKLYRSFVVVSRQVLIDSRFPTVVCAPILTRGHGFSTQVSVGVDEGLKHESWVLCDNLVSLRKVQLTRFVGSLARAKIEELDRALKMALALE